MHKDPNFVLTILGSDSEKAVPKYGDAKKSINHFCLLKSDSCAGISK